MNNHLIQSMTSYVASLTTQLCSLLDKDKVKQLDPLTQAQNSFELYQQAIKIKYKKNPEWNYLQYFQHVLNIQTVGPIKLQSQFQPFTLKEDLHIFVAVSRQSNKIPMKILQKLPANKKVYATNYRNILIKRPLKKLLQRYKFLSQHITQPEIQYIINWIQKNGFQIPVYIQQNDKNTNNETKNPQSNLNIKITQFSMYRNLIKDKIALKNKKNDKIMQKFKRSQPLPMDEKQLQKELNYYDSSGGKKLKPNQPQIGKINLNNIFKTPPKKKQLKQPGAPKKIKQEDSEAQSQVNAVIQQQKLKKDETAISNKMINQKESKQQTTKLIIDQEQNPNDKNKQKRRYTKIIDAKKDVIIKEQITDHSQQQESKNKNNNKIKIKIYKTPIIISEFNLQDVDTQKSLKQQELDEQSQQQCLQLQQILQKFRNQSNYTDVRMLKILNEVSGNLNDFKKYLQTKNQDLRWKRLQDGALRGYVRKMRKRQFQQKGSVLQVDTLYKQLQEKKGKIRIAQRIKYLGLKQN